MLANADGNLFVGAGVAVAAVVAVMYLNTRAYETAKERQAAPKAEREKPIARGFFALEKLLPFNGESDQPNHIGVLEEVSDRLAERGDKLNDLGLKTEQMKKTSEDFYQTMKAFNEKNANKKWHDF